MKIDLVVVYRAVVVALLVFIASELYFLKKETNANLREIDMVISKLDYVESDINSTK